MEYSILSNDLARWIADAEQMTVGEWLQRNGVYRQRERPIIRLNEIATPPEDWNCPVCMEEHDGKTIVELKCKHVFHFSCIKKWVEERKNSCPLCRTEL